MTGGFPLGKIVGQALDANLRCVALASKLASSVAGAALTTSSGSSARVFPPVGNAPQKLLDAPPQPARSAIVLEGVAGTKPTAMFLLQNHLPHDVSAKVEVTPMVAPGGRKLKSALQFDKRTIELVPGQQVVARVSASITRQLVSGEQYTGEIRVHGIPGASIPIVLCRLADPKRTSRKRKSVAAASAGKAKPSRPRLKAKVTAAQRA